MVVLDFKVIRVIWQQPLRGAIFTGCVTDNGDLTQRSERVVVPSGVGACSTISPGQWWHVQGIEGTFQGQSQITAHEMHMLAPCGEHLIDLLAGDSQRFPGMGKVRARKLYDRVGGELALLLDDVLLLAEELLALRVPNADEVALALASGWAELGMGRVSSWFNSLRPMRELGIKLGQDICACWGIFAQQKIEEDPYRLIAFQSSKIPLSTWRKVDSVAQTVFGVADDDPRRLHGAVADAILEAYDQKKCTVIDRDTLLMRLKDRLGTAGLADKAIAYEYRTPAFLCNGEYWQARVAFQMEKEVAEMLQGLRVCGESGPNGNHLFRKDSLRRAVADFEAQEGILLSKEQFEAVRISLANNVSVITGGTGVGKTTLLRCLNHLIGMLGGKVLQMALSGRATRRLLEITGRPSQTVARFLANNAGTIDEMTTVIIDESSMLCLPLMFQILKKIPVGCRLIIVGDADQPPPIGPGQILKVIVNDASAVVPVSRLTKVFGKATSAGIPEIADHIRESRWPTLPPYGGKGHGVSMASAGQDHIEDLIKRMYADLGGNDSSADVQILSMTKDLSPYGASGINRYLQGEYGRGKKRAATGKDDTERANARQLVVGDPVMFTLNDWKRDLFNGSVGRVVAVYDMPAVLLGGSPLHPSVRIRFDTGEHDMYPSDLENIEVAYSITVRKAHGSKFRRVIIPITASWFLEQSLEQSLIYSAVTMGIEQVVVVGDIEAAKAAVERGAARRRQAGLGHLLRLPESS